MDRPQTVSEIRKNKKEGVDNLGKRWTSEEENKLVEEIKTLSVEEIAKIHKRKTGGISARLCLIASRLILGGKTIEEAMTATKQSKDDIEQFIKKNGDGSKLKPTPTVAELENLANYRVKWTEEEGKQLMEEIKTMKLEEIANIHKRNVGGIVLKLSQIGAKMIREDKKTMDEAMLATKQSKDDIEKAMEKQAKKKEKFVNNAKLEEQAATIVQLKAQLDRMEETLNKILLKM